MALALRVETPCPICGAPILYDVTVLPNSAYANDRLVDSWLPTFVAVSCVCPLTGWRDRFTERQMWQRISSAAIEVYRTRKRGEVAA